MLNELGNSGGREGGRFLVTRPPVLAGVEKTLRRLANQKNAPVGCIIFLRRGVHIKSVTEFVKCRQLTKKHWKMGAGSRGIFSNKSSVFFTTWLITNKKPPGDANQKKRKFWGGT